MARGDHHTVRRRMIDDSKAARGCWSSNIEGVRRDAEAIHNVRYGMCESCRAETSIEANYKSLICSPSCYEISSNGFCAGPNVREREIIGDDRPPTVGPEFDVWTITHPGFAFSLKYFGAERVIQITRRPKFIQVLEPVLPFKSFDPVEFLPR